MRRVKGTARTAGTRNASAILWAQFVALVAALVALSWVCGPAPVCVGVALGVFATSAYLVLRHCVMCRYTRLDTHDHKSQTLHRILYEEVRQRTKYNHMLLKYNWSHKFYVVKYTEWLDKYLEPGETEQSAFHQVAERFDTLEQAMLYYHAVS